MKTNKLILGGLMSIAITACTSDELVENTNPTQGKKVTVTAYAPGNEANSRVSFDDDGAKWVTLSWEDSESFSVIRGEENQTFSKNAPGNIFSGTLPDSDGNGTYYGFYPENTSAKDYTAVAYDLSTQSGSLEGSNPYMYATSTDGKTFTFDHTTALLKINFQSATSANIKKVVVTTTGCSKIQGTFNLADGTINSGATGNTITIDFANSVNSNTPVYIYLPPMQPTEKSLEFEVLDSNNKSYLVTLPGTNDNSIVAGKLYKAGSYTAVEIPEAFAIPGLYGTNAFTDAINGLKGDCTKLRFVAKSKQTSENLVYEDNSETKAYALKNGEWMEIHTIAKTFNLPYDSGLMFNGSQFTEIDLSGTNATNVNTMASMFYGCSNLETLTFGANFNVANVKKMNKMFQNCSNLTALDLSSFNTAKVTNMASMFYGCSNLTTLTFGANFNTSSVADMSSMFRDCRNLTTLTFGANFNTSSVTDMSSMFSGCSSLETLNLSSYNTSSVTNMSYMFSNCSSLSTLDLSKFTTPNVTTMSSMFSGCSSLNTLNLSNFTYVYNISMSSMFYDCSNLTELDMSKFKFQYPIKVSYIFNNVGSNLAGDLKTQIYVSASSNSSALSEISNNNNAYKAKINIVKM